MRSVGLLLCVALVGCFPRGPALTGEADPLVCDAAFDDHTHVGSIDTATLENLLETGAGEHPQQVDFVVVLVADPERRHVRFEDGSFYAFHDQWYWFRLMNGVSACGSAATPVPGRRFRSIQEIERFLEGKTELPLDLARTAGGRLVSPSFYTLSLRTTPRVYATGTLFRYLDPGQADRYAFELPLVDAVTAVDLRAVHSTVEAALPVGTQLYWRATSLDQASVAASFEADSAEPLGRRTLRVGQEPPAH